MQISFQGELGSYSHQACSEAFPDAVPLPCSTFETAMDQVKEGNSEYAIIPVENSTYGRVADAYYLLPNSGLFIMKEHFLRVHINLLALPGVSLSEIYKAMGGFATNNVNMVKLESYMVSGTFTSTQFYADIEGHPDEEKVKRALDELVFFTSFFKILGVYECHNFRKFNS